MPFSTVTYAGNGSQTDWTFSFPYLEQEDIGVYVDGESVPFTFLNANAIRTTSTPPANSIVQIRRGTNKNSVPVDFTDGSNLLEKDLDRLALWALYIAQEALDNSGDASDALVQALEASEQAAVAAAAAQIAASAFPAYRRKKTFTATAGQTVFNLDFPYIQGVGALSVKVNGVAQFREGGAFTETSTTSITLSEPCEAGDAVEVDSGVDVAQGQLSTNIQFRRPETDAVARNVEDKLREVPTVKDFGALCNGTADDTAAVLKALAVVHTSGWRIVRFPAGTVTYIAGRIEVPSKSIFMVEAGATVKMAGTSTSRFINGTYGNATYASGYAGNGEIIFTGGGTIDCNGGLAAITFAHANKVAITDLTFRNASNTHFVEINSSQHVRILRNTFEDMTYAGGSLYEMVQFDYSHASGFPSFGSYDNTPCRDVVVAHNIFRNGHSGVGSHSNPAGSLHAGMTVRDNGFYNMSACGIRVQGWGFGSEVSNNYLENCGEKPMHVVGNVDGCEISKNTVRGGGTTSTGGYWFSISGGVYPKNVLVEGNKAYDVAGEGFYLAGIVNGEVRDNEVYRASKRGFMLANTSSNCVLTRNKVQACGHLLAATYDAFYIEDGCSGNRLERNYARTMGAVNPYRYALHIQGASANSNRVNWNDFESGVTGLINDGGTLTEIDGETFLTGTLSVTTGSITLNDDITKYQKVRVATGSAGANFVTDEARGWSTSGFRPGTDHINVRTKNGSASMSIATSTSLAISGTASDAVRHVIGIGRK